MKNLTVFCIALFITGIGFGQIPVDFGDAFDFKTTEEKEPKLILTDSYNAYMLSHINTDGILSNHEIIVRKFDQKNHLVETYKTPFPKLDASTLYNYLGTAAMPGNAKQLILTESYSGKSAKQDIYLHVFDRGTGTFTTTLLKSFPMESVNKKGVFQFSLSDNNQFIAILNAMNSPKKESVQNTVLMIDVATAAPAWTKDTELDMKNYERSLTATNSGKAVLVRGAKGLKLYNFLTVVSADKAETKELGEDVQLQNPKAVSIAGKDYLIGFNHNAKGLRTSDFEKFMLYDLDEAKMVSNNKISALNSVKDGTVEIRNVYSQGNEFHIFAEAKGKAGTRPVKMNQFSSTTFDEAYYKYGPGVLIVMDFEGKLTNSVALNGNNNSLAELYPSFGLVNLKGDYSVLGGNAQIYKWSPADNFKIDPKKSILSFRSEDHSPETTTHGSWDMIPSLFSYLSDSKKFLIGRYSNNKMSLITVANQ